MAADDKWWLSLQYNHKSCRRFLDGNDRVACRTTMYGLKFHFSKLKSSHACIHMTWVIQRKKYTHTCMQDSLIIYYFLPGSFFSSEQHTSKFILRDFCRRLAVLRLQTCNHTHPEILVSVTDRCASSLTLFCSTRFDNITIETNPTLCIYIVCHFSPKSIRTLCKHQMDAKLTNETKLRKICNFK